jgi:hypothetical protein
MAILAAAADLVVPTGSGCPSLGANVFALDETRMWGDINCSGAITPKDAIDLLAFLGDFDVQLADPECPSADTVVTTGPPATSSASPTPTPTATPNATANPGQTPTGEGVAGVFLTRLVCTGEPEYVRIKNRASTTVSLSGFRLRSNPISEQDFDLTQVLASLESGQEIEIRSGPGAVADPENGIYVLTASDIYRDYDTSDYAHLVRPDGSNVYALCPPAG